MKSEKTKLISFVIPTYNRAKYLQETLDAITKCIEEEAKDICEIVISNNCSDDMTEEIVNEYKKKYDYIKSRVNGGNIGVDRNIIEAIKAAQGEYLWLFGDDDRLLKGAVKTVAEILGCHEPAYVFVRSALYDITLTNRISQENKHNLERDAIIVTPDVALQKIGFSMGFLGSNILRRECIKIDDGILCNCDSTIIQSFIVLSTMMRGKTYYCSKECVMQRGGNGSINAEKFIVAMNNMLLFAENIGFSDKIVHRLANRFLFDMFIEGLRVGAKGNDHKKYFKLYYDYFRSFYGFWCFMVPLEAIPSSLLRFMKYTKDSFRKESICRQ